MMNVNNYIENNGTSGDNFKSKFRDRLKLIKINRFRKYKHTFDNKEFLLDTFKEMDKFVSNKEVVTKKNFFVYRKSAIVKRVVSLNEENFIKDKFIKMVKNDERDRFIRGVIRRIRETVDDRDYVRIRGSNKRNKVKGKNEEKNVLKVKIVRKLKEDLEKKSAELEVLEGELYCIKDEVSRQADFENIDKLKKELDTIKIKIDNIVKEFDVYKDGYYDIDGSDIMDDIIRYKELGNSESDYMLLDEYRNLYDKLVNVTIKVDNVIESADEKIGQIKDNDYRFYNLKNQVTVMTNRLEECEYQIKKQNKYMDMLMKKIKDIDRVEYTTYKLKGVSDLVFNSVKYISLVMLSPLAGIIPSIAINTLATRKMIKNLYKNVKIDKVDEVRYETFNYDFEIKKRLNDLDFTYDMVNDTIKMIDNLKDDLIKEFGNINGVNDTLGKLDDIRDKVVGNRYKMDIVRKKLGASKKINEDKLIRVKKLNNS